MNKICKHRRARSDTLSGVHCSIVAVGEGVRKKRVGTGSAVVLDLCEVIQAWENRNGE